MRSDDLVLTCLGLRFQNHLFPYSIGHSGLTTQKFEGDGATPRGVHAITGLLYRPDRVVRPTGWARPIKLGDLWSNDPLDPAYNLMVRAPYAASHTVTLRRLTRTTRSTSCGCGILWRRPTPPCDVISLTLLRGRAGSSSP